jgi:hypothetical protein
MSRFMPEMDRNAVQWQEPVGTWRQGEDIGRLDDIARKLVFPPEAENTDVLNSIPTPWSRLLLFENALYNDEHPSHVDIRDQWRGMLGLLALANPLGIKIEASNEKHTISLSDFSASVQIAKTFVDLQPYHVRRHENVEEGKWNMFHLIVVDDQLLGATSPRTLVFTAIDHSCPASIPFRNKQGKLSDPLRYFARYKDTKYLVLLRQWLDTFVSAVTTNEDLISWLGVLPAGLNPRDKKRHDRLIALLNNWQLEMRAAVPRSTSLSVGPPIAAFTAHPYNALPFLPEVPVTGDSDLLLATERASESKVVVCYRPVSSENPISTSTLHNQRGQIVRTDLLLICDGRWTTADEPLPESLDFLPAGWTHIANPIELFEDQIIEVALPEAAEDRGAVHVLQAGQKNFLFPFKQEILNYFTAAEIAQFTRIEVEADQGYRVTLQVPLVKGRSVHATRRYQSNAEELLLINSATDHKTSELAMWPNFTAPDWSYYFYFKRRIAARDKPEMNLDLKPVSIETERNSPDGASVWYFTKAPVQAFVGSIKGRTGLLLPRYEDLPQRGEKDYWNVSVDFGSTHSRVFYVRRQKTQEGLYENLAGARVEPLEFYTYAKQLTLCDPEVLKNDFFALAGKLDPPARVELKTLLMQPVSDPARQPDWRPREGYTFMQWIKGGFDDRKLKSDIKWENSGNKNDLHAYLRCLMVMVLAEAARSNAKIVHVTRSYPTAFSNALRADHNREWVALGSFMSLDVESDLDKILTEAVATARYLGGKQNAPLKINTISMDIGGSTTDIAIWFGQRAPVNGREVLKPTLGLQESVKMAAGSVGRYLQSDPKSLRFLQWFVNAVKQQGLFPDLTIDGFANRRLGFALMFYNILTFYEVAGASLRNEYNALVGLIKTRDESRGLVMHLIYLFGALCYYSGLLVRKTELQERKPPIYHVYFCGKGGTLITWINNYQRFVEKLFLAGLYGCNPPTSSTASAQPRVDVQISPEPKQEVGRGLLEEFINTTEAQDGDESFGLLDSKHPSVTVGETGYKTRLNNETKELQWNDDLEESVLRSLDERLPKFEEMKELNCFIGAIKEAFRGQDENDSQLDFDKFLADEYEKASFVDRLTNRLLGDDEGSVLRELQQPNNPHALVEPILITEMKVLLEVLSKNDRLFR